MDDSVIFPDAIDGLFPSPQYNATDTLPEKNTMNKIKSSASTIKGFSPAQVPIDYQLDAEH
jgi:hypothetical protein